jgi:hypothetical protein
MSPLREIPVRAFAHTAYGTLKNCEDQGANFRQICLELSVFGLRSFSQCPHGGLEAGKLGGKTPPERNWNHAGPNLMIGPIGLGFFTGAVSLHVEEAQLFAARPW